MAAQAAQTAEVTAGKSKKKMVWLWELVSVLGVVVVGLAAGLGVGGRVDEGE